MSNVVYSSSFADYGTYYLFIRTSGDEELMPETSLPTPPGFDALSKAEQVRYLQAPWDQISEDPATMPVPESHLRLAEERLKRCREDLSRSRFAFDVPDLPDTSNPNVNSK